MHSIAEIPGLIAEGDEDAFYSWSEWRRLKQEVLRLDHFECQECRRTDDNAGLYSAGSEKYYRSCFWTSKGELFCSGEYTFVCGNELSDFAMYIYGDVGITGM